MFQDLTVVELYSRFVFFTEIVGCPNVGDGRSAGHDTKDGGKMRLWLRMATETAIYRSHVPI